MFSVIIGPSASIASSVCNDLVNTFFYQPQDQPQVSVLELPTFLDGKEATLVLENVPRSHKQYGSLERECADVWSSEFREDN